MSNITCGQKDCKHNLLDSSKDEYLHYKCKLIIDGIGIKHSSRNGHRVCGSYEKKEEEKQMNQQQREQWLNRLGDYERDIAENGLTDKDVYEHLRVATGYFRTEKVSKHVRVSATSILRNYRSWLNQGAVAVKNDKHKQLLNDLFIECRLCEMDFFRADLAHVFYIPIINVGICNSCNKEAKKKEKANLQELYNKVRSQ